MKLVALKCVKKVPALAHIAVYEPNYTIRDCSQTDYSFMDLRLFNCGHAAGLFWAKPKPEV